MFHSQKRIKVVLFSYNLSPSVVIHGNSWKKRLRGLLSTTCFCPLLFLSFDKLCWLLYKRFGQKHKASKSNLQVTLCMYKLWVRNTTWTFLVLWFPFLQRNLKNFPNYVTHGNYPFQPKQPVSFSGNFQWRMEQQTRLKKANIILFSMSRSFRIIPAIADNFGRFSNTT